jgi:prepilin-type N-terminal cleavage/methylation domain-containing protein
MDAKFMFFLRPQVQRRKGFTLVEVIVVLVILAILAAIAIPALTGYIDKARDKQYIAEARNALVAIRAVLNESYADKTLGAGLPDPPADWSDLLTNGYPLTGVGALPNTNVKYYNPGKISLFDTDTYGTGVTTEDWFLYSRRAAALMGTAFPEDTTNAGNTVKKPGFWEVAFMAPRSSDYTIFNAPGWIYIVWPEGRDTGKAGVIVTYGIDSHQDTIQTYTQYETARGSDMTCDSDAGYKVYHVTF